MERKRYIPPDPREHKKMPPPPTAEQVARKIQNEVGLPLTKVMGTGFLLRMENLSLSEASIRKQVKGH